MNNSLCIFCDSGYQKNNTVLENELFFADFDINPVNNGHMKVISKRHVASFFDLSVEEIQAAYDLIQKSKNILDKKYRPRGYNIGINIGEAAGQTIFHLHIHIIPRYLGDVSDPVGGIRHIIPGKGNYFNNK